MTYCVFSDLHGDEVGLDMLLGRPEYALSTTICLGDVINAHIRQGCAAFFAKLASRVDHILLGNHEAVLIGECAVANFNSKLRPDIIKHQQTLNRQIAPILAKLRGLPRQLNLESAVFTHASFDANNPWQHVRYIEDIQQQEPYLPARLNFLGHGHIPFIAWQEDGLWYYERQIYQRTFQLRPATTYIINCGSILGSREMRRYEKSFVIFDDSRQTITFHNLVGSTA